MPNVGRVDEINQWIREICQKETESTQNNGWYVRFRHFRIYRTYLNQIQTTKEGVSIMDMPSFFRLSGKIMGEISPCVCQSIKEVKRLEDATVSLGERSITGYAETTCRRARMYAAPMAVWKTVPCPNPYDNKVASFRRFSSCMALADAGLQGYLPPHILRFAPHVRGYRPLAKAHCGVFQTLLHHLCF